MSPIRILALVVVLAALATLELTTGFTRLQALRDGRAREVRATVGRDHQAAVQCLRAHLDSVRTQAALLAALPALTRARSPGDDAATEALVAFLHVSSDATAATLTSAAGDVLAVVGEATSPLPAPAVLGDLPTISLRAGDPLRATITAAVGAGPAPHARLVVELAPGPLERELRPAPSPAGVRRRLVTTPAADSPAERDSAFTLLAPLAVHPPSLVETFVPESAFKGAADQRESLWIVISMVGVTTLLALVGIVVARLAQRAFQLNETEHYLRWIRRVTDRYRSLMEGAADMILIVEPRTGELREANAAARLALGLHGDDDLARPGGGSSTASLAEEHLAERDREAFRRALADALGSPGHPVAVDGLHLRSGAGGELVTDGHFALIDLGNESVVQVSLRDVTRQRAVERQLHTAERLSSLGLLTAGVAHEINNPLEGIGNYLSLVARDDLPPPDRARYLEEVRHGFGRIQGIVQDLLTFARPPLETGAAVLNRVVESALGIARFAPVFKGARVELALGDDDLVVAGDLRRLEQVVLNLLLNAARAIDGDGTLRLAAQRHVDDEGTTWVDLVVEDDGPGIPPEELDHLFDPFFSAHGGTGLGLSVSFGIVEAHGGMLRAGNRAGGGAAFTLSLPATSDDPERVRAEPNR